jgi:hypothetical protein
MRCLPSSTRGNQMWMATVRTAGSTAKVAAQSYGLPPKEFTANRKASAKQARQAGDRELAEAIGDLAKPNMVGWLINQMVREYPQEIESLANLGASLRSATAELDAEQLRDLSSQQRQVVHALVQQARSLGLAAGHPVSEDTARGVEETLHAALADADAAAQVRAGQLTGRLTKSGFPSAGSPSDEPDRAPGAGSGPGRKATSSHAAGSPDELPAVRSAAHART